MAASAARTLLASGALQLQGGGNCANALTGASRLGLRTALITKIGADSIGDTLVQVPRHARGRISVIASSASPRSSKRIGVIAMLVP